jgi:hypothetical protein
LATRRSFFRPVPPLNGASIASYRRPPQGALAGLVSPITLKGIGEDVIFPGTADSIWREFTCLF